MYFNKNEVYLLKTRLKQIKDNSMAITKDVTTVSQVHKALDIRDCAVLMLAEIEDKFNKK